MAYPSTQFDITVMDQHKYVIGYAVVKKTRCEVYNFISPTLRILRFVEGCAEWRVDDSILTFSTGDVVILSNLNKRNIHDVKTDHISYEVFDFYPASLSSEQLWNVFYREKHLVVSTGDDTSSRIYSLMDMLRCEILGGDMPYRVLSIQMLLHLLTIEFQRKLSSSGMRFSTTLFSIAESVKYISENLTLDLSVPDLAEIYGYTPEYYSRIFRKYIGIPPVQYIIQMRLENTLRLVNVDNMTILDAAYLSGFRSSSAFYKAFRSQYATSPTKYLKALIAQEL